MNYFLEIDNKILKFINKKIINYFFEFDNPKSLKFVNPMFDTG